jgi:hypothetical protein
MTDLVLTGSQRQKFTFCGEQCLESLGLSISSWCVLALLNAFEDTYVHPGATILSLQSTQLSPGLHQYVRL